MSGGTTKDALRQLGELPEDGEKAMQRKIAFVHALAKHLLRVFDDDTPLFVGVQPGEGWWRVQVSYQGFLLQKEAVDLSDALEQTLQHLAKAVSQRLEEGSKLLVKIET